MHLQHTEGPVDGSLYANVSRKKTTKSGTLTNGEPHMIPNGPQQLRTLDSGLPAHSSGYQQVTQQSSVVSSSSNVQRNMIEEQNQLDEILNELLGDQRVTSPTPGQGSSRMVMSWNTNQTGPGGVTVTGRTLSPNKMESVTVQKREMSQSYTQPSTYQTTEIKRSMPKNAFSYTMQEKHSESSSSNRDRVTSPIRSPISSPTPPPRSQSFSYMEYHSDSEQPASWLQQQQMKLRQKKEGRGRTHQEKMLVAELKTAQNKLKTKRAQSDAEEEAIIEQYQKSHTHSAFNEQNGPTALYTMRSPSPDDRRFLKYEGDLAKFAEDNYKTEKTFFVSGLERPPFTSHQTKYTFSVSPPKHAHNFSETYTSSSCAIHGKPPPSPTAFRSSAPSSPIIPARSSSREAVIRSRSTTREYSSNSRQLNRQKSDSSHDRDRPIVIQRVQRSSSQTPPSSPRATSPLGHGYTYQYQYSAPVQERIVKKTTTTRTTNDQNWKEGLKAGYSPKLDELEKSLQAAMTHIQNVTPEPRRTSSQSANSGYESEEIRSRHTENSFQSAYSSFEARSGSPEWDNIKPKVHTEERKSPPEEEIDIISLKPIGPGLQTVETEAAQNGRPVTPSFPVGTAPARSPTPVNVQLQLQEQQLREQQMREQHLQEQLREQQLREQQLQEQLREQQLREQQLREQQQREQQLREQQLREQQLREQQQREQQLREQQLREQQLREQQLREQQQREQQLREQQLREQQLREQQLREQHQQEMKMISQVQTQQTVQQQEPVTILSRDATVERTLHTTPRKTQQQHQQHQKEGHLETTVHTTRQFSTQQHGGVQQGVVTSPGAHGAPPPFPQIQQQSSQQHFNASSQSMQGQQQLSPAIPVAQPPSPQPIRQGIQQHGNTTQRQYYTQTVEQHQFGTGTQANVGMQQFGADAAGSLQHGGGSASTSTSTVHAASGTSGQQYMDGSSTMGSSQFGTASSGMQTSSGVQAAGGLHASSGVQAGASSTGTMQGQHQHQQQYSVQQRSYSVQTQQQQQQQQQHGMQNGMIHHDPSALSVDTNQHVLSNQVTQSPSSVGSQAHSPQSMGSAHMMRTQMSTSSQASSLQSPGGISQTGQSSPSVYFGHSRQGSVSSVGGDSMEIVHQTPKFVRDTSKYWYKPHISREEAINMLKDKPPGTFVVRDSNSFPGAFGLALKVAHLPPNVQSKAAANDQSAELVRHFLIEPTPKGVKLKGCSNEPVFGSLAALVYQHSITPLALPCKLLLPGTGMIYDTAQDFDMVDSHKTEVPSTSAALLEQGAACNVLYISSVDMESLTGPEAVAKAVAETFKKDPVPKTTVVHFKVSNQGITLTDNKRKLFFRRHYAVNTVTYCGMDPEDRRWSQHHEESGMPISAKVFGFVARKQGSAVDNACHLFAELDPEQPASAIVNFVMKVMSYSGRRS